MAMYNTTEKMKNHFLHSKAIHQIMGNAFAMIHDRLPETLSPDVLQAAHLMPYHDAIENIHFPKNPVLLRDAEYRLKFEELFYIQLNIVRYAADRKAKLNGFVFKKSGKTFQYFLRKTSPFSAYRAQKRVIKEYDEILLRQTDESTVCRGE